MENKVVHIKRAVQALPGKGLVFVEPKTESFRRAIPLTDLVVENLSLSLNEGEIERTGLIFHTASGKPIFPRNLLRHFHNTLDKLGIPRIRFHALRHNFASLLLTENVHPKVVQEMLGHSTIMLTLETYSHLVPTMRSDAAEMMNSLLQNTAHLLRIEKNTADFSKKSADGDKNEPPYVGENS